MPLPLDTFGRPMHDLRISVTDRCNFRCTYCMPREVYGRDYAFLPRAELLTFEEISRLAGVFASLGVHKLRLTGGEPLLRRDLDRLVAMLVGVPGVDDVTLTTNGSVLARHAQRLAEAGLQRITVSLDSLDDATFMRLNDAAFPVRTVLEGIAAAVAAGLTPVKVNMVVRRGVNEASVLPMARWARDEGHILRFIEYMDVGHTNGWRMDDVVPAAEILAAIDAEMPHRSRTAALPGRGGDSLALPRRQWRGRRDRLGHPALLRRLHARPTDRRRPAVHLPVRQHRPRPSRAPARRGRQTAKSRIGWPPCGRTATTAIRSYARPRPDQLAPKRSLHWRCSIRRAWRCPESAAESTQNSRARMCLTGILSVRALDAHQDWRCQPPRSGGVRVERSEYAPAAAGCTASAASATAGLAVATSAAGSAPSRRWYGQQHAELDGEHH